VASIRLQGLQARAKRAQGALKGEVAMVEFDGLFRAAGDSFPGTGYGIHFSGLFVGSTPSEQVNGRCFLPEFFGSGAFVRDKEAAIGEGGHCRASARGNAIWIRLKHEIASRKNRGDFDRRANSGRMHTVFELGMFLDQSFAIGVGAFSGE
jgi:hypothetical protein